VNCESQHRSGKPVSCRKASHCSELPLLRLVAIMVRSSQLRELQRSFIDKAKPILEFDSMPAGQPDRVPRNVAEAIHACGKDLVELCVARMGVQEFPVLNILGDQSAAKTTVGLLSLTEMPVFITDHKTGTKAKTLVNISHDPNLAENDARCSIQYDGIHKTDMSAEQLAKEYRKIFEKRDIDPRNMCHVHINVGAPCLGLVVVDHPGLVMSSKEGTLDCQQRTVDDFLAKPNSNGSIVLCHGINKETSECGWNELVGLDRLPIGCLTMVVTRMDQLDHNSIGKILKDKAIRRALGINTISTTGKSGIRTMYEVTKLQILKAIEHDFRYGKMSEKRQRLPDHAKVFFVASFRGSQIDLKKHQDLSVRRHYFLEDEKLGERSSESDMFKKLSDAKAWKQNDIILKEMVGEEVREFDGITGMERLAEHLLQKQTANYEALCRHQDAQSHEDERANVAQLSRCREERQRLLNYSDAAIDFLKQLVLISASLNQNQPLQPLQDHATTLNEDAQVLSEVYERERHSISWSRQDELEHHSRMFNPGEFPPADRQEDMFDELLRAASSDDRAFKLQIVVERLRDEFSMRTMLLKCPELDFEELLNEADRPTGSTVYSMSHVVAGKISEECTKIYKSGIRYFATRAANLIFMNAQGIAKVVSELPRYSSMCQGREFGYGKIDLRYMQAQATEQEDDAMKSKRLQLTSVTIQECLVEFMHDQRDRAPKRVHPIDDVNAVMYAMFFHRPEATMEASLKNMAGSIAVTICPKMVTLLESIPLFMHRDPEYIQSWYARNYAHDYTKAFGSMSDLNIDTVLASARQQLEGGRSGRLFRGTTSTLIYEGEEDSEPMSFFHDVPDSYREVVRTVNDLPHVSPQAKVSIMKSILSIGVTPDDAVPRQEFSAIRPFEKKNLDYMLRRNLIGVHLQSLLQVVATINGNIYEWVHPQTIGGHQVEAEERLLSMQLGFKHACTEDERVKLGPHLSYDRIMHFIFRMKAIIKTYFESQNRRAPDVSNGSSSLGQSEEAMASSQEKVQGGDATVSEEERLMIKESPFVRCIFTTLLESPEEGTTLMEQLLRTFNKEPKVFKAKLSEVLAKDRYRDHDPSDAINKKIQEYEEAQSMDKQFGDAVRKLHAVLQNHGKDVIKELRHRRATLKADPFNIYGDVSSNFGTKGQESSDNSEASDNDSETGGRDSTTGDGVD